MGPSIYGFTNYKEYLNAWLKVQPKEGHGLRKRLAEHIGTQTGFVTQVLGGSAHFGPEQVYAISQMIGHSPEESHFMQLLLHHERAGSIDYKKHIHKQMQKIVEDRKILSQRLKAQNFPSEVDQHRYFSSWVYACLHVMTTCERFQVSRQAMAEALGLSLDLVSENIEFLIHAGLIKEEKGRLVTGNARLHLGTNSPYLPDHHRNWNLLAMQKISTDIKKDLHYSSVVSLAAKDYDKVKEIFMRAIEESKKIVKDSEGEKIYTTTLHFFEIC